MGLGVRSVGGRGGGRRLTGGSESSNHSTRACTAKHRAQRPKTAGPTASPAAPPASRLPFPPVVPPHPPPRRGSPPPHHHRREDGGDDAAAERPLLQRLPQGADKTTGARRCGMV
eukprot:scaffold389_cov382-Prasinococcus_capsulatus_cf.AAC.21